MKMKDEADSLYQQGQYKDVLYFLYTFILGGTILF